MDTAFEALSLVTTFESCLKAYHIFSVSAAEMGEDMNDLAFNIRIEHSKFEVFGRHIGVPGDDKRSTPRTGPGDTGLDERYIRSHQGPPHRLGNITSRIWNRDTRQRI